MSDHADIVREALTYWSTETLHGRSHAPDALAALEALVAERDQAHDEIEPLNRQISDMLDSIESYAEWSGTLVWSDAPPHEMQSGGEQS